MLDCLELLHFHIGSQITAIRAHKDALREASRIFVGLHEMGARPRLLDVGGGLGVDYDGSQTNFHSSMNYSMQEYANDVVAAIQEACDEEDVPHPDIVTEAGRAMVAHHSVLIFDVLGVHEVLPGQARRSRSRGRPQGHPGPRRDLRRRSRARTSRRRTTTPCSSRKRRRRSSRSATSTCAARARVRAAVLGSAARRSCASSRELPYVPDELEPLEKGLADTYYGNFSVFQSVPDHWAVKQLFPVMPIHRLDEKPTRRGVFADLTCDSDGKIDSSSTSAT